MGRCPTVETERLILRPLCETDLDAMTALYDTPAVRRWLHLAPDFGREQVWASMAANLGQWELRNTGNWAVEETASGVLVGRAGPHFPERANWPGIEIGWTLHPDHWGKGYATEAGAAARDWVFANHDVDAVYSCILDDNVASQGVARRLGFSRWETRVLSGLEHMVWRLQRAET
jgi:RimJ/RimL family protein N-acetyltransferase